MTRPSPWVPLTRAEDLVEWAPGRGQCPRTLDTTRSSSPSAIGETWRTTTVTGRWTRSARTSSGVLCLSRWRSRTLGMTSTSGRLCAPRMRSGPLAFTLSAVAAGIVEERWSRTVTLRLTMWIVRRRSRIRVRVAASSSWVWIMCRVPFPWSRLSCRVGRAWCSGRSRMGLARR